MSFNFTYNYPEVARDSGFKLRNYKDGPLDWRLMGSMEVERILKDQNLEQIDSVLSHLSEVPLGSMLESNILDSGIAKYFILSQFSVQYLLFCRKFLEETVADLRDAHGASQMELVNLKRSLGEANNEILQLHKKITQMEAIHEVIYPCHLCTKNFVSNDALNLHISRKHSGAISKPDKRSETPQGTLKERENDLTLINTIKLELEIKQLKERLNNAEKEIKNRNPTPSFKSEKITVNSIGIQSNLSEHKEKDEYSEDEISNSSQHKDQMHMLQEKLQEFERWKEEQKKQNSDFLSDIKNKLQDLSEALEITKNQREQKSENEQLRSSPSVEDLEVLLSKKVDAIGKASAAKLEELVNEMELNCRNKMVELEKEMKKINEKSHIQKVSKASNTDDTCDSLKTATCGQVNKIKSNDDTFEILETSENKTYKTKSEKNLVIGKMSTEHNKRFHQNNAIILREKSSSESYHTFVKSKMISNAEVVEDHKKITSDDDDCTEISESLKDDDEGDAIEISKNAVKTYNICNDHFNKKKLIKPKIVTRKEAKKLADSRLVSLGVETKTKSLPQALRKRIADELSNNRNKLKQKYPNFYATRNKIKKIVDKLCSSEMPKNAETLLKVTKPLKVKSKLMKSQEQEYPSSDDERTKVSTPFNDDDVSYNNTDFKQRLERILASPIRKPTERRVIADIHQLHKPVPLPRKRVMFNQPEIQDKRLNESLTTTDSE